MLGVVRFDALFLGIQLGVISTRLGSLFRSEGKTLSTVGGGGGPVRVRLSEGEGVCVRASVSTLHSKSTMDELFERTP